MRVDLPGRESESEAGSEEGFPASADDPRVANGLDEYLAELQAGRRPSRREFLARHPEIAGALDRGLDVLEFLHSAAGGTEPRAPGPPDGEALPPETVLGDYRLIREIGRGGMGVVYEARQVSLDRRVAVKVLSGAGVLDPRRLQRFQIEAQAVAHLNHAHIVPIYAVGSAHGIHFYAMQYIEGYTLAEILEHHPARRRRGDEASAVAPTGEMADSPGREGRPTDPGPGPAPLTPPGPMAVDTPIASREAYRAIAQLGIQAAEALDHAHAMGVLHRDIKPSNLLIDPRGSLWVTDFGLARFRDDSGLTLTGDLVGTLRYMAPEMAAGQRMSFDPRSDIYSLGATLYELLTLRPVFEGKDRRELLRQITQDEPTAPRRIDRSIPRDLETIVMKAMDKDPGRRYATAGELAEDLRRFLDDQPIQARPPSPWERVGKWARRHRAILMAAAGGALVALGIGLEMVWQERQNTAKVERGRIEALKQGSQAFGESFRLLEEKDRFINLSDQLTMRGMERFARTMSPAGSAGDPAMQEFYRQALDFYEGLTREPSIGPEMKALAYRRLGFTRMVSQADPRAEDDYLRSIALYESLLAKDPRNPDLRDGLADVYYNLGIIQYYRGRMALADPSFQRAIDIVRERASDLPVEPGSLDLLANHRANVSAWKEQDGMKAEAQRERRALLEEFERLTRAATSSGDRASSARWAADAYRSLAATMAQHGWVREQEEALRRGLAFEPKHRGLLLDFTTLLAFRRDADPETLDKAVQLAKEAVALEPQKPEYWRVLALANLHRHDLEAATRAIERSLDLPPKEGRASDRLVMAMISWQRGRRDEAERWYVEALDRMARNPAADPVASSYMVEARVVLKPMLVSLKIHDESEP